MTYLPQSLELLTLLRQEHIRTLENTSGSALLLVGRQINIFREMLNQAPEPQTAPVLTKFVALTLLKVGACLELTHRFALEYFLRFRNANVALIMTANEQDLTDNHCFALIGPMNVDDGLIMTDERLIDKKFYIPIKDFLNRQKNDAVIADPLLDFADAANGPCRPLIDYCNRHNIAKVIGVVSYSESILPVAAEIKANAERMAGEIFCAVIPGHKSDEVPDARDLQKSLIDLMKKFKLSPDNSGNTAARGQALRRAAMAGTIEDLSVLLSSGIDINAQDENPEKRNTALHLALIHQKLNNAIYLMTQGAKVYITNAEGKTIADLVQQLPSGPGQNLLRALIF